MRVQHSHFENNKEEKTNGYTVVSFTISTLEAHNFYENLREFNFLMPSLRGCMYK